ncbi:hypothetical protein [Sigmofec virus UA08Rod_6521]|uniref:Uncharacterized protein n=1 Tax=Sigmofec virus UA08Rod_6521 TaxID=2929233 RepID=A0A976R561_9VIRU|nr:hypothetical protein [Sigmofec virus UA08Rod_6521]
MTYFAKGKKCYRCPTVYTLTRLYRKGYREIVWCNGDFMMIPKPGIGD